MEVIFCSDPLKANEVDSLYSYEAAMVRKLGIETSLFSYEGLVGTPDTPPPMTLRKSEALRPVVYRGWMMNPDAYGVFYRHLLTHGAQLINSPEQYRFCHHLPASYAAIEGKTPRSVWLPNGEDRSIANIMRLISPFGDRA